MVLVDQRRRRSSARWRSGRAPPAAPRRSPAAEPPTPASTRPPASPDALAARPGFRLGWSRFPDGAEVLSLDDAGDGGFGYAVNLTAPDCSEWGYAPFPDAA